MMHELNSNPEKCLLASITWNESRWETEDHLAELSELAKTAGAQVLDIFIQEKSTPDPAYFIGKGKLPKLKNI